MSSEELLETPKSFVFEGNAQSISFVETMNVTEGVVCEVYAFEGDNTKDLGIIKISSGCKTPLQKVLKGDKTIEGYVSGKGVLTIIKIDGSQVVYPVGDTDKNQFSVTVNIGETMQWTADKNSSLVAYEICFPPYEEGRYENINN